MTEMVIELTEDDFGEQYVLVENHIDPSASWVYGNGRGCLFETYGEEFAFVRSFDPRKVWTLVDGDDGDMYVMSGLHFVNRVGYLLSRDSVPDDVTVEVHVPMGTDEEESLP